MGISPVDFLNLTGAGRIAPISNPMTAATTTGGGTEDGGVSGRALDRAPRAVGFEYDEFSNVGGGYAGKSKWSCYM